MAGARVGVIGDGQLARMMQQAAIGLGVELVLLTDDAASSAGQVITRHVIGRRDDESAIRRLASETDVMTFEFELLPPEIPERLAADGVTVRPCPGALLCAQDKAHMRRELTRLGVPCPRWALANDAAGFDSFAAGAQVVAKPPRGGYDGHGVRFVTSFSEIADWASAGPVLLEERVEFARELALMFARRPGGEIRLWPVVESVQADGICVEVAAPAPHLGADADAQLRDIAARIGEGIDVTGVCAIEAFELAQPRSDGTRVVVNELALRPHNSGHWTLGGAATSQFEQHLRAVLDWPLGPSEPLAPAVAMVNVLGSSLPELTDALPAVFAADPAVRVELYGKEIRPGRKLGHVTVLDVEPDRALARARAAAARLRGQPSSLRAESETESEPTEHKEQG